MKPRPISPVIPIEVLIPGNLPRRCSVSLFLLHSEVPIARSRPSDPMNQMFRHSTAPQLYLHRLGWVFHHRL